MIAFSLEKICWQIIQIFRWVDISQADKGVTFITDSKYGWHVRQNHVSLSLLKSPKNPDDKCDMHKHYIYYAVMPHKGRMLIAVLYRLIIWYLCFYYYLGAFQGAGVIQKAYELNTLGSNNVPLIPAPETAYEHISFHYVCKVFIIVLHFF